MRTVTESVPTHIHLTVADAIATLTFDHPPANALSTAVIAELEQHVTALEVDDTVHVVVFTSRGTAAFLSGADINELPARIADPAELHAHTERVRAVFARISNLPQPTIAAVQADAVGGGLEFALLADLIIANESAKFGLPEVRLGLIPGAGGTQRLSRRIPSVKAAELILLGSSISATEARDVGLVNQVCELDSLDETVAAIARPLASRPQVAVRAAKQALKAAQTAGSLEEGLAVEATAFARAAASEDAKEGCLSFLERRKPTFTHR